MPSHSSRSLSQAATDIVSEPDPRKIEKRVWEIGWGGSVHCARNAGALPIGFMIACLCAFIGNTNRNPLVLFKETENRRDLLARDVVGALISSYWAHGQLEVPEI